MHVQAQRQHVDNLLAILQEGVWQHDWTRVASAAALALPQLACTASACLYEVIKYQLTMPCHMHHWSTLQHPQCTLAHHAPCHQPFLQSPVLLR